MYFYRTKAMKPLSRDILITLTVKCMLLIALWWVCFKDAEKPTKDTRQWMLGTSFSDAKHPDNVSL